MSENNDAQVNQTSEVKSENRALHIGEVMAIRRSIKGLEWRHRRLSQDLSRRISRIEWNNRRYREVMADIAVYQVRFRKLDESYLQLYQVLEGDEDAEDGYLKEWDRLVTEERALKNPLEDKLGDYTHEEEPGGEHAEPPGSSRSTPKEEPGGNHAEPQEILPRDADSECKCGKDYRQMQHLLQAMQQYGIYHIQEDSANKEKGCQMNPLGTAKPVDDKMKLEIGPGGLSESNIHKTKKWLVMDTKQNKDETFMDYLERFTKVWHDTKFDEVNQE